MTMTITLSRPSAEILARALRQLDSEPAQNVLNTLSEIGHELGAILGMTSAGDDSDPLDEFVNEGDRVNFLANSDGVENEAVTFSF